jgi:hypothetical protein
MKKYLAILIPLLILSSCGKFWDRLFQGIPHSSIEGTVCDKGNKQPLAEVEVHCYNTKVVTNARGYYQIHNLPVTYHQITLIKEGYLPQTHEIAVREKVNNVYNFFLLRKADYFPLELGAEWTYFVQKYDENWQKVPLSGEAKVRIASFASHLSHQYYLIVNTITAFRDIKKIGGKEVCVLEARQDDQNQVWQYIYDEVSKREWERLIFKLNAAPGEVWPIEAEALTYAIEGKMLSRNEEVKVEAGTFTNCLQIKITITCMGNVDLRYWYWFAPNVGIVKGKEEVVNPDTPLSAARGNWTYELVSTSLMD